MQGMKGSPTQSSRATLGKLKTSGSQICQRRLFSASFTTTKHHPKGKVDHGMWGDVQGVSHGARQRGETGDSRRKCRSRCEEVMMGLGLERAATKTLRVATPSRDPTQAHATVLLTTVHSRG